MSRRDEQLLFRYSSALERGDFETVAEVLRDAERDPVLEQMILDVNAAYTAEPSLNHKNPKEVPMIAALYQKPPRPSVRVQWQSLPLVAALAVIGLLVAMLAVQTRSSNLLTTGQGSSTPLAIAQNDSICQATTLAPVNIVTLPGTAGVIIGTIPAGQVVTVQERRAFGAVVWYFITAQTLQGWITIEALDTKNCRETAPPTSASTPTLIPNSSAQPSPYPTALAQSEITCAASTNMKVDLLSVPLLNPHIIGSLPVNTLVQVLDFNVWLDAQQNQTIWYYVKADNAQGWALSYQLDAASCPPIPDLHIPVVSADTQAQTATSEAATQYASFFLTATYVLGEATRRAEPPTFTPTPAPFVATIVPPVNDTAGTAQYPFLIAPTFDSMELTSVVATLNATYQATMIPVQNSDQAAACSTPVLGDSQHMTLYERPATDSPVVNDFYTVDATQSHISVLQAVDVSDQTWYYIEIGSYPNQPRGWVTAGAFTAVMGSCAALNVQTVELSTPVLLAANAVQQATLSCNSSIGAHALPFTLYAQPGYDASVISATDGLLDPHWITWLQTAVHAQSIWYQVQYIASGIATPQIGWVMEDQFNTKVLCALIRRGEQPTLPPPPTDATPVPASQQSSDVPAVKCPTPASTSRVIMYARPSLDSYNFSQDYDAAGYAFFLLDSTDLDGQPWYFVRIASSIDDKQGWITWDDYNMIKDCAPFNTGVQANALPSAGTVLMVPTVVPPVASGLAVPTLVPADVPPVLSDVGVLLDTCHFDLPNTVTLYAEPSNDAKVTEILHIGTSLEVSAPTADWYWVTVRYPDGVGSSGFVRADTLTLPDDCHLTPPGTTTTFVPTLVPASVQALPTLTPIPANAQVDPADCAFSDTDPGRIQLYARPSLDSGYAYDAFSSLYIPQNELSLLDAVDVGAQAWYFVQIHGKFSEDMRGWMTEEEFNKNVRCAPLVNPGIMTQVAGQIALSATPTPAQLNPVATSLPPTVPPPTPTLVR